MGSDESVAHSNGFIPNSFRAISGCLKVVSSSASCVASTVRSASASVASSIGDRGDDREQVQWAGFDKLEFEGNETRQVLLLGFPSGFQVWDVEEKDKVHELVSRYDVHVSFLQMQQKPLLSKRSKDKFGDLRPLLVVAGKGSSSGDDNSQEPLASCVESDSDFYHPGNDNFLPTIVQFYSMKLRSYVHFLKFSSAIFSIRCSPRVVAICQAAQIQCFDAFTLERKYNILTNPMIHGSLSFGSIGHGPLAVGSRWLAYSGYPVTVSSTAHSAPQHLTPISCSASSNGSVVGEFAKESRRQLATGIITLGDKGYNKLSRYCSELLPDSNTSLVSDSPGTKIVTSNDHSLDSDSTGMVIVRDIVGNFVLTQFRAHKSPISALCFDPSGILLVTASTQGHNINVYKIMPSPMGNSSESDLCGSCVHLYRLQRGLTNAVIQDISFSDDIRCIMISSSRGTSHLFSISSSGGPVEIQSRDDNVNSNCAFGVRVTPTLHRAPSSGSAKINQQNHCLSGPPVTLSVVGRIKNHNNSWRGTVCSAAAAATGKPNFLNGAIASSFCSGKSNEVSADVSSSITKYHLLVLSPSGCLIQYLLHLSHTGTTVSKVIVANDTHSDSDVKLTVEPLQKWDIYQKPNGGERVGSVDIYGDNGQRDSNKIFPEETSTGTSFPTKTSSVAKLKIRSVENHYLYFTEAELQTHQVRASLWAKSKIYFHLMMMDKIIMKMNVLQKGKSKSRGPLVGQLMEDLQI